MSEHPCKNCGKSKPLEEMMLRHGRARSICRACFSIACRVKRGLIAPAAATSLRVEPGFGFEASIDDNTLVIEQVDASEKTDQIVLTRAELRRLIDAFGSWAAA